MLFASVLLPDPVVPITPSDSPDSILNEIFFKPVILVSGYLKETFLNSILPFKSIAIFSLDVILFSSLRN